MVNKIDGNHYYVYTKQKKIDIPDTDEKFSLGYQKNKSSSGAKNRAEVSEKEKQQALEQNGVRLELSVGGQATDADRREQTEADTAKTRDSSGQMPLFETIRTYIMAAITAVREFFHNIWNDRPQEDVSGDSLPLDGRQLESDPQDTQQNLRSTEGVSQNASPEVMQETAEIIDATDQQSVLALEEERRSREIRQSLRDGDMERVISLLTDNGRKTIARNSTLLTSYDKNGRLVEPNASDRERALHGDRNSWKL